MKEREVPMIRYFLLLSAAAVVVQPAFAAPVKSVKAAGFADKTFALYFEADYTPPETGAGKNLRVEAAKVILVTQNGSGEGAKRIEMSCKDGDAMLAPFQSSPYGRGSEGGVIGLECAPQGEFIFALNRESQGKMHAQRVGNCGKSGMLNSSPAAYAVSFGHQAFCLEDWSAVKDPGSQLEIEFKKLQGRKGL